jgi:hypothetical protein
MFKPLNPKTLKSESALKGLIEESFLAIPMLSAIYTINTDEDVGQIRYVATLNRLFFLFPTLKALAGPILKRLPETTYAVLLSMNRIEI